MQGAPRGRSGTVDTPEGNGTGFVWDSQGHVVTNFHVLASALKGLKPNQLQGEGSPKVARLTLFSRSCLTPFHTLCKAKLLDSNDIQMMIMTLILVMIATMISTAESLLVLRISMEIITTMMLHMLAQVLGMCGPSLVLPGFHNAGHASRLCTLESPQQCGRPSACSPCSMGCTVNSRCKDT